MHQDDRHKLGLSQENLKVAVIESNNYKNVESYRSIGAIILCICVYVFT
jgi:hypothetical protein